MEDNNKKEYHFLKEETKKIPTNKKKFFKRVGCVVIFAAIFGVVACLVFCLLKPAIERKQEAKVQELSEAAKEELPEVQEPIYIQETVELTIEQYEALQTQLYSIGTKADKSVVEINSVTSNQDWFADDFETRSHSSGVILQDDGSEILILTETANIANANQIQVTFYGDETVPAYLKAYDGTTGIAVLAVESRSISENTESMIQQVELADPPKIVQGTFVIGIGSPQGESYSVSVGNITDSNYKISFADKNYRFFITDMSAYEETRGVLLDKDGKVVGLIYQDSEEGAVRAIAISEITDLINKLKAGKRPAYLGIRFSKVTMSVSEDYGLPDGIYIKEVEMESPAMQAGIQVGDILVSIDGKKVLTETEFEEYMVSAEPEQKMNVTVMRLGANDQYQEVNCKVELGVAK